MEIWGTGFPINSSKQTYAGNEKEEIMKRETSKRLSTHRAEHSLLLCNGTEAVRATTHSIAD